MVKRRISWNNEAKIYFVKAIAYIRKDSPQNAHSVKRDILEKILELSKTMTSHRWPEKHPADKYKLYDAKNPDLSRYRSFELHHYRISYLIKEKEILIVRLRHTSQEPQGY